MLSLLSVPAFSTGAPATYYLRSMIWSSTPDCSGPASSQFAIQFVVGACRSAPNPYSKYKEISQETVCEGPVANGTSCTSNSYGGSATCQGTPAKSTSMVLGECQRNPVGFGSYLDVPEPSPQAATAKFSPPTMSAYSTGDCSGLPSVINDLGFCSGLPNGGWQRFECRDSKVFSCTYTRDDIPCNAAVNANCFPISAYTTTCTKGTGNQVYSHVTTC